MSDIDIALQLMQHKVNCFRVTLRLYYIFCSAIFNRYKAHKPL